MAHEDIKKMVRGRLDEINNFITESNRDIERHQSDIMRITDQRDMAQRDAEVLHNVMDELSKDERNAVAPGPSLLGGLETVKAPYQPNFPSE